MSDKYLLLVSVIANAVIFFSIYSLEEKRDQWKLIQRRESKEHYYPADFYTHCVTQKGFKEYNFIAANNGIVDLAISYGELPRIYEMYLADYHNEPTAIQYFWGEGILGFYFDTIKESKISPIVLDYSISLLKKVVNKPISTSEEIMFKIRYKDYCNCCSDLHDIYSNGEYIPRDTALANYYRGLIENRK